MGDLQMSGVMPNGHIGTLMPRRMFFVEEARATLEGEDLGRPTHAAANPMIGEVPLPARGVLAIGQGMRRILDHVEYERTRKET
jgi:6-phosphogluconolactonase/glucosamine-6-phosphate isomerase/deaminase